MHSEGNYKQGAKTTLRMGENDSKWNKSDDERQIVWFYSYVGYKKLINKKSPQTN